MQKSAIVICLVALAAVAYFSQMRTQELRTQIDGIRSSNLELRGAVQRLKVENSVTENKSRQAVSSLGDMTALKALNDQLQNQVNSLKSENEQLKQQVAAKVAV